jgi:hypothetical protein
MSNLENIQEFNKITNIQFKPDTYYIFAQDVQNFVQNKSTNLNNLILFLEKNYENILFKTNSVIVSDKQNVVPEKTISIFPKVLNSTVYKQNISPKISNSQVNELDDISVNLKPLTEYQKFQREKMLELRRSKPGLKTQEYMKLAAIEWGKKTGKSIEIIDSESDDSDENETIYYEYESDDSDENETIYSESESDDSVESEEEIIIRTKNTNVKQKNQKNITKLLAKQKESLEKQKEKLEQKRIIEMIDNMDSLKVTGLRELCKSLHLSTTGYSLRSEYIDLLKKERRRLVKLQNK